MGGDNAPAEIVKGALEAVGEKTCLTVILVGKEELIKKELSGCTFDRERVKIQPASEVILMGEAPAKAIMTKRDSSINVGMKLVKKGEADAFISAGSTGAVLVGSLGIIKTVKGVKRPALAPLIPTENGPALLIDCGANVDARPDQLEQFAVMGSLYMEHVVGRQSPRVGLANIGVEEEKGNALVKKTLPLLKERTDINFIGNVEARDIPSGEADVIVCEAFTGNVILKMYEGVSKVLLRTVKKSFMTNVKTKIGGCLVKGALKSSMKQFDASEHGGAPLLGLNGLVVKTHGNAKAKEIRNTLYQCIAFHDADLTEKIRSCIEREQKERKEES